MRAVLLVVLAFLAGCAGHDTYRMTLDACNAVIALSSTNDETTLADSLSTCALQTHVSPGLADKPFHLAFLELDERTNALKEPAQMDALLAHLDRNRQNVVVAFVHGWRHDAMVGDLDVRRFRALLAYSNAYLDHRCEVAGRYCGATLTGVYVGWRARSFAEPPNHSFALWSLGAGPTFWSRKALSERHAETTLARLTEIQDRLTLRSNDPTADKMLVVGHSFGGNMLAHALSPLYRDMVDNHAHGAAMPSALGDLAVIVNPAAEASKWTALQRAFRTRYGGEDRLASSRMEAAFPVDQAPLLVSITSSCDWNLLEVPAEGGSQRKVACDTATGRLFPLGMALAGHSGPEQTVTIGHLDPAYRDGKPETLYGTSHEFIINLGANEGTEYARAGRDPLAVCSIVDSWVIEARRRSGGRQWDSDYSPRGRSTLTPTNRDLDTRVQFRHALSPNNSGQRQFPSVVSANFPFWNMRSPDSVIREHGGFVSHALWCAMNQLVLDNVTAPPH